MTILVKKLIKQIIGIILIVVGLLALLTPLTPGSWLALIGMELLGIRLFIFKRVLSEKQQAAAEVFMEKLKARFKKKPDKPDEKQP
jgi:hypothetical protein